MFRTKIGAAALLVLACGSPPAPAADAGFDASRDDAAVAGDVGSAPDVGPDALASDVGMDALALDVGTDAGSDVGTDAWLPCVGPPGLYADGSCTVLAAGVRAYHPRYALWSDGADKERFVYLPPGSSIDTSDPDRWGFPIGTRLYKTFSIGGVRIETRILEKIAAPRGTSSWTMTSYVWSADQRSVTLVGAFGAQDVLGTTHDVPSYTQCVRCHSVAQDDAINGFSAVQLAHDEDGVTLAMLNADGWLSAPIDPAQATIPGDATAQAALGYLHANCGNCHGGPAAEHDLDFQVRVGTTDVTATRTWATAVCGCSAWSRTLSSGEHVDLRIDPSHADLSVSIVRMGTRVLTDQMPPIGIDVVDPSGIDDVSAWITSLPETANGCPHGCPWP